MVFLGPRTVVQYLHDRDPRVQGLLVRWAVFRAQGGANEDDPRNWFIITPVQRGTSIASSQGFAEMQLYGHVTHTEAPSIFFNPADMPSRYIHYRIFYSIFPTDLDGNVVTGAPPQGPPVDQMNGML